MMMLPVVLAGCTVASQSNREGEISEHGKPDDLWDIKYSTLVPPEPVKICGPVMEQILMVSLQWGGLWYGRRTE